ncbi:MAG: phosphate ABC transporter permease subunit PstC [Verrucomicrobiota bacterium]
MSRSSSRWQSGDRWLLRFLRLHAVLSGGIILLVLAFLVGASYPALERIGLARFFTDSSWNPSEEAAQGRFNLGPMLVGSLLVTAGAILLAAPVGLASALFCRFHAPERLASWYRRSIELLAGIPSVVFGFWGLVVLVPLLNRWQPPGQSLLAAVLLLALMILPTVALLADAALGQLPQEYRLSSEALGISHWAAVGKVLVPAAGPGIWTGLLLATARAMGETLAVLMVCGNIVQVPGSVFEPVRTLTTNIALEMAYAAGDHRTSLFFTGLLLTGVVMILVGLVEKVSHRNERRSAR